MADRGWQFVSVVRKEEEDKGAGGRGVVTLILSKEGRLSRLGSDTQRCGDPKQLNGGDTGIHHRPVVQ